MIGMFLPEYTNFILEYKCLAIKISNIWNAEDHVNRAGEPHKYQNVGEQEPYKHMFVNVIANAPI